MLNRRELNADIKKVKLLVAVREDH